MDPNSYSVNVEFVGVVPAAGLATRLGNIPCSKEILPLRDQFGVNERRRVFSDFLLEAYRLGGIQKVHFILRSGKWDIPSFFENGAEHQLNISYLVMQYPFGVPFTLYEACPFVRGKIVALGFPDIVFSPKDAFKALFEKIVASRADVVLGLFPIRTKSKWDMVELDEKGKVTDIIIKKKDVDLEYGWTIAVWGPRFTEFMEDKIRTILLNKGEGKVSVGEGDERELYVGDLFLEAVRRGMKVDSVKFTSGKCIDLGTKEDMEEFRNSVEEWDFVFGNTRI